MISVCLKIVFFLFVTLGFRVVFFVFQHSGDAVNICFILNLIPQFGQVGGSLKYPCS